MASKSKKSAAKKPAAKAKKPAAKKPVAKKPAAKKPVAKKPVAKKAAPKAKPAATAKAAAPADDGVRQELEAARATIMRLTGDLHASRADGERFQADHERAGQRARDQQVELDRLRADIAAANRKTAEAPRPVADSGAADEARRKTDEATRAAADSARKADEAARRADDATRKLEEATRRADDADRRAVAADRERGRIGGELMAARAEMTNYKLRCPKCGKNFVEENFEGITIDRCSGCDAVYFDAGEVDQLLAAVHEKMSSPSADPQQTSGWFRNMFKRKPKAPATGGESPPPA
jgi:Zn-finger nucleic acid-binding protein